MLCSVRWSLFFRLTGRRERAPTLASPQEKSLRERKKEEYTPLSRFPQRGKRQDARCQDAKQVLQPVFFIVLKNFCQDLCKFDKNRSLDKSRSARSKKNETLLVFLLHCLRSLVLCEVSAIGLAEYKLHCFLNHPQHKKAVRMITPFGVVSNGDKSPKQLHQRKKLQQYFFLMVRYRYARQKRRLPRRFSNYFAPKKSRKFYIKVFRRNGAPVGGGARQPPPKKTLL